MFPIKVLVGTSEVEEWSSTVEGLYQVGPTSVIAHFKLAGMHVALERSLVVNPRTGEKTSHMSPLCFQF